MTAIADALGLGNLPVGIQFVVMGLVSVDACTTWCIGGSLRERAQTHSFTSLFCTSSGPCSCTGAHSRAHASCPLESVIAVVVVPCSFKDSFVSC